MRSPGHFRMRQCNLHQGCTPRQRMRCPLQLWQACNRHRLLAAQAVDWVAADWVAKAGLAEAGLAEAGLAGSAKEDSAAVAAKRAKAGSEAAEAGLPKG